MDPADPPLIRPRMFTDDDLIDCILEALAVRGRPEPGGAQADAPAAAAASDPGLASPSPRDPPAGTTEGPPGRWRETPLRGRRFLSEREIRKALTPGAQQLTIAKDAIVSPLALDWLALKGIRIVRE